MRDNGTGFKCLLSYVQSQVRFALVAILTVTGETALCQNGTYLAIKANRFVADDDHMR